MITYDDFKKLEITIGEIKGAEVVENADTLLKLAVDFGETNEVGEPYHRQVVSGIREHVADPAELVGMKCPFVTNLEPRTIRGFESQAMILAASSEETFALLTPNTDLPPGTRVI